MLNEIANDEEYDPEEEEIIQEPPKKKRKVEEEIKKNDDKQGDYFWNTHLHEEFMKHFSVWGKTWKVVS